MLRKLLAQRAALKKEALNFITKAEEDNSFDEKAEAEFKAMEDKIKALDSKINLEYKKEELAKGLEEEVVEEKEEVKPNITAGNNDHKKFKSLGENLIIAKRAQEGNSAAINRIKIVAAAQGLNEAVSSDGGYLVQEDFSNELLKNAFNTGILSQRCRRVTISNPANKISYNAVDESSRVDGSRGGGVLAKWEGEAEQFDSSKPKFKKHTLELKKLTGLCYTTDELLNDAAALDSFITQAFNDEFGFKIDDAIIRGTGAGQPLGFLNSPALVTVAKESGQAADTVVANNIYKMYTRMPASSVPNSIWLINQQVWTQLLNLNMSVGTGGLPIFLPPSGISAAPYGTLLGRPIVVIEQASALGDAGDINFVDLSSYALAEKGGIDKAVSMHVRFEYGETAFRFILRADGQPMWSSPLTPYKGTSTLSPFVILAERAS